MGKIHTDTDKDTLTNLSGPRSLAVQHEASDARRLATRESHPFGALAAVRLALRAGAIRRVVKSESGACDADTRTLHFIGGAAAARRRPKSVGAAGSSLSWWRFHRYQCTDGSQGFPCSPHRRCIKPRTASDLAFCCGRQNKQTDSTTQGQCPGRCLVVKDHEFSTLQAAPEPANLCSSHNEKKQSRKPMTACSTNQGVLTALHLYLCRCPFLVWSG